MDELRTLENMENNCDGDKEKQGHKNTRCCNKQSAAIGQNQSTLIKQAALRETLTEHERRKTRQTDDGTWA